MTLLLVALGGAVGAVLRWWLGDLAPSDGGVPWTTLAINVTGCFALACLPAWSAVRDRPRVAAALGPGLLGGYTTMSAYAVGTALACLLAVLFAERLTGREPTAVVEP